MRGIRNHQAATVELRGSRAECVTCGAVFSGARTFDMHRTGSFEPDTRRCMTPGDMEARGLFLKPSGVWGEGHRRAVAAADAGQEAA